MSVILYLFVGCKYQVIVKKENIVKTQSGYVFFTKEEQSRMIRDYFIPVEKVDTSLKILDSFLESKKKVGYRISIEENERVNLIYRYADSLYNNLYDKNHLLTMNEFNRKEFGVIYILPVEIKYTDIYPVSEREKGLYREKLMKNFIFNDNKVNFEYFNGKNVWLLHIFSLIPSR